jgi:hypothetical protein
VQFFALRGFLAFAIMAFFCSVFGTENFNNLDSVEGCYLRVGGSDAKQAES